uniref:FkbM family methyltransferase n=1 Tax=Acetatifactor sp. TaxID=1872090 RepID=UPI004057C0A3
MKDWVYNQLQDEESKLIWREKTAFNADGDFDHIKKIVENVPFLKEHGIYDGKAENKIIDKIKERKKKLVIYGAGFQGNKFYEICKCVGAEVAFFCDGDRKKQHTLLDGKVMIVPLEELLQDNQKEKYAFVVCLEYIDVMMKEKLLEEGIKEEDIYLYNKMHIAAQEQYFEEEFLVFQDGEVFIDGGCLDLGTSLEFIRKMENQNKVINKIYAFEPDSYNLKICARRIAELQLENVEMINAGLWNCNTCLEFRTDGNGGSCIVEEDTGKYESVKVVSLDSAIQEKVTFIKMDIEGAELNALKGAEQTIRRDKPKLAICVYHKKEDMWEIPYFIKQLVPEYRLYIRHYSNCPWETVLYAVI